MAHGLASVFAVAAGVLALTRPLAAQVSPTSRLARVSGVVYDSVAGAPLRGAVVQLVATDDGANFTRGVRTDSYGEFTVTDVPAGRYVIGFQHPMLDSLGVEPPTRSLTVRDGTPVRSDLSIPGPATIRAAVCGAPTLTQTGTLIVGYVRDARTGAPVANATITGQWFEYALGRGGVQGRRPTRVAKSFATGWFALCNVPSPGQIALQATSGSDSTDLIEFEMPRRGFARTELTLAPAGHTVRMTGVVQTAVGGQPLPNVQVAVSGRPPVRTNLRGEFTLTAPAGTRTLDARLVGYYPVHQVVSVQDSMPTLRLGLSTLRAVLDTMKVVASLGPAAAVLDFEKRRRSSPGRFIDAREIAQRNPTLTSDLFRAMVGVYLETITPADTMSIFAGGAQPESSSMNELRIMMRGVFANRCVPLIFVNGAMLRDVTAAEVDMLVSPRELLGVEVYQPGQVPPQFDQAMNGCGSVVFWRR